MTPKVTISILAYEGVEHSKACIESVLKNSFSHQFELILTDNGSTDGTAAYFAEVSRRLPARVRIVTNEKNLGFIEPNRKALEMAKGEFFVLLNNDARVPRGWLTYLLQPFDRFKRAALTGPEGSCCELTKDFSGTPGRHVDYIEGSCLMGKTEILRRHGLFSDYLKFAYHEDSDLSLRMQELGYSIHRAPFKISHIGEGTSRRVPEVKVHAEENRKAMIQRWGAWRRVRKFDYVTIIRRRASSGDVLLATAVVKAVRERCPQSAIMVETDFPEIFAGNTRITRVSRQLQPVKGAKVIDLDMAYENRPERHIIKAYEEVAQLGPIELRSEYFGDRHNYKRPIDLPEGPWVAIHAGPTTWEGKNWPEERWNTLIQYLDHQLGYKILLVGNQGYNLGSHRDQRGLTNVHELAAHLRACDLFIGVDSFPMHMAQAVGTPVVPLFGVTSAKYILTFGSKAYPVESDPYHVFSGIRHKEYGKTHIDVLGNNPMETIQVDQVIENVHLAMGVKQEAVA